MALGVPSHLQRRCFPSPRLTTAALRCHVLRELVWGALVFRAVRVPCSCQVRARVPAPVYASLARRNLEPDRSGLTSLLATEDDDAARVALCRGWLGPRLASSSRVPRPMPTGCALRRTDPWTTRCRSILAWSPHLPRAPACIAPRPTTARDARCPGRAPRESTRDEEYRTNSRLPLSWGRSITRR